MEAREEVDEDVRDQLYKQIAEIACAEDVIFVYRVYQTGFVVTRTWLKGYYWNPWYTGLYWYALSK